MPLLDDLKDNIGGTVYFSHTLLSLSSDSTTVKRGTLIKMEGPVCVVEWEECLCLDEHGPEVECGFKIRDMISVFLVQLEPPKVREAS